MAVPGTYIFVNILTSICKRKMSREYNPFTNLFFQKQNWGLKIKGAVPSNNTT